MSVRTYRFPKIDRVVHGAGAVNKVPALLDELGKRRCFVVTGHSLANRTPVVDNLVLALGERWVGTFAAMGQHAPKRDIDAVVELARAANADCLVGIGGSSVTDATKIVAVRLLDADAPQDAMPQVLVPTTLSAGEYTPASGMTGDVPGVKTYVVDPRMAPFAVVLDPAITVHTPMDLWLSTGMKSVDHACEMLWGPRSHPMTDALAREALRSLVRGLPRTKADPDDLDARLECQIAGWMSMSGVSNVQVYLSHTIGHQVGARWDVPHGITSGITLPAVMRLLHRERPDAMPGIAAAFGVDIDGLDTATATELGAEAIAAFVEALGLPGHLRDVGGNPAEFAAVAQATVEAGRATGFGGSVTVDDIEGLLETMW